jgi:hypothetical protein
MKGRRPIDPALRFAAFVARCAGCWEWTGALHRNGYGAFKLRDGRQMLAHRFAWELANGAVPEGLNVLHQCDNRRCVRPDHLFVGTQRENIRDMVAKGRHFAGGTPTHCPSGHVRNGNTRFVKGHPVCRLCRAETQKKWRQNRNAA